jgi:hypothetical protein
MKLQSFTVLFFATACVLASAPLVVSAQAIAIGLGTVWPLSNSDTVADLPQSASWGP